MPSMNQPKARLSMLVEEGWKIKVAVVLILVREGIESLRVKTSNTDTPERSQLFWSVFSPV